MKRVLITGSRDWNDADLIANELTLLQKQWGSDVTLVSGHCLTGADMLCERIALGFDWSIERHPAEWNRYGKAAGPRRNQDMVNLGADICLAFIRNGSRGASGTAKMAEDSGITTFRFKA
jgi:hypothetical protein